MTKLTHKETYKIFPKVFNGPSLNTLLKWEEKIGIDDSINDVLLQDAIIYFGAKYLKKVEEILKYDVENEIEKYFTNETINKIKDILEKKDEKKQNEQIILTNYQEAGIEFLDKNRGESNLIIMPTGYGKTILAFNEIIKQLQIGKKIIFTAPTNELVEQQQESFLEYLDDIGEEKIKKEVIILFDNNKNNSIENSKVLFMTPHKMDKYIEEGIFDESYFYIIDEVHEGTKKEKEEYKYPALKNISKLENKKVLAMTATISNLKVLRENLGIKNIFNGSDKKYFIAKNRNNILLNPDENYEYISNRLDEYTFGDTYSGVQYISSIIKNKIDESELLDKDTYELLNKFSFENLSKTTYMDKQDINSLIGLFPRKQFFGFHKKLWKVKKLFEVKKRLEQNSYLDVVKYIDEQISQKSERYYFKEIREFLFNIRQNLIQNHNSGNYHPKTQKMFEIVQENKKRGKKTLIYVENKEMIDEFVELSYKKGFVSGYIKGGVKNKTSNFIKSYIKERILNDTMDVVFTTSASKLGMNYNFDNLVFYHQAKNYEDFLQFEGRIGRYSKKANIWNLAMNKTAEENKINRNISAANYYMNKQFEFAKNFLEGKNDSEITSIYSKIGETKKNNEITISELLDTKINEGEFINARFKLIQKLGIYKNTKNRFYASIYIVDKSSNRGIIVNIFNSSAPKKDESKIKELNNYINGLNLNNIYQIAGRANQVGIEGYDKIINISLGQSGTFINEVLDKDYDKDDYNFKQTEFGSDVAKIYPNIIHYQSKQKNYLEGNLFE